MSRVPLIATVGMLAALLTPAPAAPAQDTLPETRPAPDYSHAPEMRRLLHWARFPLRVCFLSGSGSDEARAARAGFNEWVCATHEFVRYQIVTDSAQADVTVAFLPQAAVPDKDGANGNTGLTFSGLALKKARIRLATADTALGDIQETAAHEFGHALGMDGHSDDADDLMFPVLSRNPPPSITLRDLNTLKIAYPKMTVFAPPNPPAQAPER